MYDKAPKIEPNAVSWRCINNQMHIMLLAMKDNPLMDGTQAK